MLAIPDFDGGLAEVLRLIEEKFGVGTFVWNIHPEVIRWSDGMFTLFGLAPGSVAPSFQLIQAITHPQDRRSPGALNNAISNGLSLDREFRVVLPSGCVRWLAFRSQTILGATGKPEKIFGACLDITERHKALADAELEERRRAALIEVAGGLAWLASPDGRVMDIQNWGTQRGPDVSPWGNGWLDWVHPEDRDRVHTAWKDAVAEKKRYFSEHRVRSADGTYHLNRSRAVPLMDNGGNVLEWVGNTFDVEEQTTGSTAKDEARPLTGAQIRGARGILKWSLRDLAEAAGVSPAVLRRLEEFDGPASSPGDIIESIHRALSEGGVEFLHAADGKSAIRLR